MTTPPSKPFEEITEAEQRAWKDWLLEEGKRPRPFAWGRMPQTVTGPAGGDCVVSAWMQAPTILIPVHMIETINKLVRMHRLLQEDLGREPTTEELAARMELPVSEVRKVLRMAQEPISLENPVGEEEESHLGDPVSESEYDYEPALNKVIEHSADGKRYIVGVRNAELQRLEELKDEGKFLPGLRPQTSR